MSRLRSCTRLLHVFPYLLIELLEVPFKQMFDEVFFNHTLSLASVISCGSECLHGQHVGEHLLPEKFDSSIWRRTSSSKLCSLVAHHIAAEWRWPPQPVTNPKPLELAWLSKMGRWGRFVAARHTPNIHHGCRAHTDGSLRAAGT